MINMEQNFTLNKLNNLKQKKERIEIIAQNH